MVSLLSPLARIIETRWPIAWILTLGMAGVILAVIAVTTLLDLRQERDFFRRELEARGQLLAYTLNDVLADPLYFLDVDKVEDFTTAMQMSQDGLPYIQVFRSDGSLLTDTLTRNEPPASLATGFVESVLQTQEPLLEFSGEDLEVTIPIMAGSQLVGIVHFDLSTASLNAHLTDVIRELMWQGLALLAGAALLGFAVARYVTKPLQALRTAALSIGSGNLDEQVPIGGPEETASLGQALDSMRTELKGLYQDLEGQVAERTLELSKANEDLQVEIIDRKRLAQESQLIADIGRKVSASPNINEVFENLGADIRKMIPFDRFSLSLVDHENQMMSPIWTVGTGVLGRQLANQVPLAGSLTGEVVRTKLPIMVEAETETELEHRFPGIPVDIRATLRSYLLVPLFNHDDVLGVLRVGSKKRAVYSQRHLNLLERIASQIAGAVANARLLAERAKAEEALREGEERFRQMAENMREVFFLVDHENYKVLYMNRAYEEVFGRSCESLYEQPSSWLEAIHPEDIDSVNEAFEKQLTTGAFDEEFRIIRPDGSVRWIHDSVVPIRDEQGQISRLVGIAEDITEHRQAEAKVKASLNEKEVLLKEINHRVKNNLQIISSLLDLQSRDIHDEQALQSFQVSQDRIRAMALVHEKLYQSEDLARIDFGEYIRTLATDLGTSYGLASRDVYLKIDVEKILLGVDTAIPCGVIVNELVSNSLKHAFPDRPGKITVRFREADGQYAMIFKDDGIGLPLDFDISNPPSMGLTIVNALTGQIGGTIELVRNGGSEISITFPSK